jgi:hypothetical protein
MLRRRTFLAALSGLGVRGVPTLGAGVGHDPRYSPAITSRIGGKPLRLVLTGTAMRTKYGFSVYAIGSYLQEGIKVRSGEELAKAAVAKQLHLIFERDVDGETMASAFRDAIGMGYPAPAFAGELARLEAFFRTNPVKRGDHIWLTHVPGLGLGCQLVGKPGTIIENIGFAHATWDVYVGAKNLGVAIQSGLTSRL